jgi:hypothetical protein
MPPPIADVRPTTPVGQDILGGTCPLAPIQVCILWSARQEKMISSLAFRVYFATHEVKFWRSKTELGEPYHYEPYAFQPLDVGRLLPGVPAAKITKAFSELEASNILTITDSGIWFAEKLNEVTVNERVKHRAQAMFQQLHTDTRDEVIKIPRRLLKLLVQCGRRIVRAATLIGILLTTMLTKRTAQYEGYKGCVKAKWIGKLFGVDAKRVNLERARLIAEGWFRRLPTPQRVKNRWGEWVALDLSPTEQPTLVDNSCTDATEVQPLQPDSEPEVQPPLKEPVSPSEIYNNQELIPGNPKTGAYQPKNTDEPTWTNITLEDLRNDTRSEELWQEAIQRGFLKNTQSDRVNFFAAIAHALRVAKRNACGLLRTVVEKGLWHVISLADEYNAIQRSRRSTDEHETKEAQRIHASPFLTTNADRVGEVNEQPFELSEDALIVQTLTADLQRAGVAGDVFRIVQKHGYLQNWDKERWLQAERELAQARLLQARQRYRAIRMASIQEVIEENSHEDSHYDDRG